MKRLTTDTPDGNFETMLNYVYGKDGFAHIRFDGEQDEVPLTSWAKAQCLYRGCDDFPAETPEEIDETLCECVMDCPECPIALAYCFACQAVHLRSRLKMYEDILFDGEGKELVTVEQMKTLVVPRPNDPLTLEELREMDGAWVWVIVQYKHCKCDGFAKIITHPTVAYFEQILSLNDYGKTWLAYRRKPEERAK